MRAALRQTRRAWPTLIPDYHNPTGALDGRRRPPGRPAHRPPDRHDGDRRRDLRRTRLPARATPAAAIDPSVITIGSLSKPVWGGLRIGWVRASAELVRRLAALRASIDMGGAVLDQLVAAEILPDLDTLMPERVAGLRRAARRAARRARPRAARVARHRAAGRPVAVGRAQCPAVDLAVDARRTGRRDRRTRLALRRRRHARAVPAHPVRAARRTAWTRRCAAWPACGTNSTAARLGDPATRRRLTVADRRAVSRRDAVRRAWAATAAATAGPTRGSNGVGTMRSGANSSARRRRAQWPRPASSSR